MTKKTHHWRLFAVVGGATLLFLGALVVFSNSNSTTPSLRRSLSSSLTVVKRFLSQDEDGEGLPPVQNNHLSPDNPKISPDSSIEPVVNLWLSSATWLTFSSFSTRGYYNDVAQQQQQQQPLTKSQRWQKKRPGRGKGGQTGSQGSEAQSWWIKHKQTRKARAEELLL